MNKYTFVAEGQTTLSLVVNARSLEEAITKAKERRSMSVCSYCEENGDGEWGTGGELDFTPNNLIGAWENDEDIIKQAKEEW